MEATLIAVLKVGGPAGILGVVLFVTVRMLMQHNSKAMDRVFKVLDDDRDAHTTEIKTMSKSIDKVATATQALAENIRDRNEASRANNRAGSNA